MLTASTFTPAAITLTRNGMNVRLTNVTVRPMDGSGTAFAIGGLGAFTGASGNYVLKVNAAGLRDLAGNAGSGAVTVAFAARIAGPKVVRVGPIAGTITAPPGTVPVTLSRPTAAATFTPAPRRPSASRASGRSPGLRARTSSR